MLNASIPATMIALKCPRCGVVQIRARLPSDASYECRHCLERFDKDAGGAEQLAADYLAAQRLR
jgi:transposase